MKTTLLGLVLTLAALLGGCAPSSTTFPCGSAMCNAATQYCEDSTNASGVSTGQQCVNFPATGCTGENLCDSCLSSTAIMGRTGCGRLRIGNDPAQYSVSVQR